MHFTEEHIMMRKMVRDFARKEIAPVVELMESTDEFPERLIKKWAKRD
ncbi:Acyl-CoA dehydrogenase [Bacillus velezensis]|nr:Acyl-CoA dehydrogenase [Bacillus velezensis]